MRWSIFLCLILASMAFARPRNKRSIGELKTLISNKLFGLGGRNVIIARPTLNQNETYRFFRIPGVEDFFIKVSRTDKDEIEKQPDKAENDKPNQKTKEAVIVTPDVAIIGSYLGTTTQKETLLAIEIVKNLVMSGILTGRLDSSIHELLIPQQPFIEGGIIAPPIPKMTKEDGHILVPEYPTLFVPPAPKLSNPYSNSKFYYKQEGHDANMEYVSYDNKDVLVKRTEKYPPLPQGQDLQVSNTLRMGGMGESWIDQPLRINGPPYSNGNQGTMAGNLHRSPQNPFYNINQGTTTTTNLSENNQNSYQSYNVNQGMTGSQPGTSQGSHLHINHGTLGKFPTLHYNPSNYPGKVPSKGPGLVLSGDQGMSGNLPLPAQNPTNLNTNTGVNSGSLPSKDQNLALHINNQGMIGGIMPGKDNSLILNGFHEASGNHPGIVNPSSYSINQGTTIGNSPGQGPNPSISNQGMNSGNIAGSVHNSIVNSNQGLMTGNTAGQNPSLVNYNQGMISQRISGLGQNSFLNSNQIGQYQSSFGFNQGNTGQYNGPSGNFNTGTPPGHTVFAVNGITRNIFGQHPSSLYGPGIVGSPSMLPYLSTVNSVPTYVPQAGIIGNGPPIYPNLNKPLGAVVSPYLNGYQTQRVIICKEVNDKACSNDKILNQPIGNKPLPVTQQNVVLNDANVPKNKAKEFLKNHTVNGQIITQYSYKQINTHSNDNYTEVKVGESPVKTNKELSKDFVLIPPEPTSRLNIKEENDKNAFTSVKTNVVKRKRLPLNRIKSLKQNPIVVAEKRSNTDEDSTNIDNKVDIPGSMS